MCCTVGTEDTEMTGTKRSDLINWYLNEISGDIDSEAELVEKKIMVEKVLDRLVHHVSEGKVVPSVN